MERTFYEKGGTEESESIKIKKTILNIKNSFWKQLIQLFLLKIITWTMFENSKKALYPINLALNPLPSSSHQAWLNDNGKLVEFCVSNSQPRQFLFLSFHLAIDWSAEEWFIDLYIF